MKSSVQVESDIETFFNVGYANDQSIYDESTDDEPRFDIEDDECVAITVNFLILNTLLGPDYVFSKQKPSDLRPATENQMPFDDKSTDEKLNMSSIEESWKKFKESYLLMDPKH